MVVLAAAFGAAAVWCAAAQRVAAVGAEEAVVLAQLPGEAVFEAGEENPVQQDSAHTD